MNRTINNIRLVQNLTYVIRIERTCNPTVGFLSY